MKEDVALKISIPGLTVRHAFIAAASSLGVAGACALSKYSAKIAAGVPSALTSMRAHEAAISILLSTITFLPLVDSRAFSKARVLNFWKSIPYTQNIENFLSSKVPEKVTSSLESGYLYRASELVKKVPSGTDRALEAGCYLFAATAAGSIGLSVLRSTSWLGEQKTNGIALSLALMAIKGLYHFTSDLPESRSEEL